MTPVNFSFIAAATGTTIDLFSNDQGKFNYMVLKTPNFTNAITTKIQILDKDGDIVWDMIEDLSHNAAVTVQAENTTVRYQFSFPVPIYQGWKIRAVLSGDAGGTGGTIKCMIAIEAN